MRVGFTGTRQGCTKEQKLTFTALINYLGAKHPQLEFHHGDCVGADAEAHDMIEIHNTILIPEVGWKPIPIHIHPPIISTHRANRAGFVIHETKDYITRNHDIVDSCDLLIATPKGFIEEKRSGTWATIRYANTLNKEVCIIYPDGKFE